MSPTNAERASYRRGSTDAKQPGPQALDAIAEAVRRSREQTGTDDAVAPADDAVAPADDAVAPADAGPRAPDPVAPAADPPGSSPEAPRRVARATLRDVPGLSESPRPRPEPRAAPLVERARTWARGAGRVTDAARHRGLLVLAALVVVLSASLIIAFAVGSSGPSSQAGSHQGTAHGAAAGTRAHPGTTTSAAPGSSTVPSSSTTAPPPATPPPGGGPGISSVSPGAAAAGQVLTVSGANLFSADGHVQATVGGEAAGTSCSTQTTCEVTVPALGGAPRTTTVTITTEAGTSNPVAFSYS